MKLVIAEKPSVAQALAKVIGASKRQDGYLEGGGYLVSWCVGHLVELSAPEHYDERYAKWRLEDLPSTDYLLMGKSIDKEMTRTQLLSVISQLTLITQGL